LAIVQYRRQSQDAEIVNSMNFIANAATWYLASTSAITVLAERENPNEVLSTVVQSRAWKRLIWYWYAINGERAVSNFGVKILEGKSLPGGNKLVSTIIAISSPFVDRTNEARAVLQRIRISAEASIDACMHSSTLIIQCRSVAKDPVEH
jgi:EpsI family protein